MSSDRMATLVVVIALPLEKWIWCCKMVNIFSLNQCWIKSLSGSKSLQTLVTMKKILVSSNECSTATMGKGNCLWFKVINLHLPWRGNWLKYNSDWTTSLNGGQCLKLKQNKKRKQINSGSKIRQGFVLQNLPTRWLFVCYSTDYHFKQT